ncbi:MAG: hypothetical protein WCS56_00225 [Bacilli bacterium]
MYVKDIVNLVQAGKFPVVRFTEELDEVTDCGDSVIQKGMLAKITKVLKTPYDEDWFQLTFDLSIAREQNIALLSHDWRLTTLNSSLKGYGTALEAGFLHDDLITTNDFSDDTLLPCEFVESDSFLASYLAEKGSKNKLTYIEWLEEQLRNS